MQNKCHKEFFLADAITLIH